MTTIMSGRITTKTFEWKRVKVSVSNVGEQESPMQKGAKCVRYAVRVEAGRVTHEADAWGSIVEHEKWSKHLSRNTGAYRGANELLDHKGIAAMVVDELSMALSDPDEFVSLCMGDLKGLQAAEAAKKAEATVTAAARFGEHVLSEAVEQIREEGLL